MSYLTAEVVKKSCSFVLQIEDPLETVGRLAILFINEKLLVAAFEMYRYRNGDAMLILKCQIENEKITKAKQMIEEVAGVMKLESI